VLSNFLELPVPRGGGGVALRWSGPPLTLIGPGEVKFYLADFDLKLQENL
jgi:hypothetical protein